MCGITDDCFVEISDLNIDMRLGISQWSKIADVAVATIHTDGPAGSLPLLSSSHS